MPKGGTPEAQVPKSDTQISNGGAEREPGPLDQMERNMSVIVNTPVFLEAMRIRRWTKRDTCVLCHIDNKTLNTILFGRLPKRLDAWSG